MKKDSVARSEHQAICARFDSELERLGDCSSLELEACSQRRKEALLALKKRWFARCV